MKRPAVVLALLFLFVLITRLCHSGLIWVEEAYPAAGALQIHAGKVIYRDFWFDKPPLTPFLYLLWDAQAGIVLRSCGALFVFACCGMLYRFGRAWWSTREGLLAAALLAFFLTFDTPAAVMAIAPDLAMVLPHVAAVYLAFRMRPAAAGAVAGVAMLVNPKAAILLPVCLLWATGAAPALRMAAGFAAVNAAALGALWAVGALPGYYQQVWVWGNIYSRDTFLNQPLLEGMKRTASWLGFHAALTAGAAIYWLRERGRNPRRMALWVAFAFVGVVLGLRFFPRYYFLLLPPLVLAAARGWGLVPVRWRLLFVALLAIPLIRFGPRYVTLAADLLAGRETLWTDTAMNRDSRNASALIEQFARPGDTLLVWGYRPDVYLYTRLPAGTPFLDSQPLTGVIADRHLTGTHASAPELAAANRAELRRMKPSFVVDGLGPYNPGLAVASYPDLREWLAGYDLVGRTAGSIVYRLRR